MRKAPACPLRGGGTWQRWTSVAGDARMQHASWGGNGEHRSMACAAVVVVIVCGVCVGGGICAQRCRHGPTAARPATGRVCVCVRERESIPSDIRLRHRALVYVIVPSSLRYSPRSAWWNTTMRVGSSERPVCVAQVRGMGIGGKTHATNGKHENHAHGGSQIETGG